MIFLKKINLNLKAFLLLYSTFFILNSSFACQCPPTTLSLAECDKYELIFRGKILSSTGCIDKKGVAIFQVLELFKGNSFPTFKVSFECEIECAQAFDPGAEWIIYTNYKQIDLALMDWCSRSRKFFKNEKEDYYSANYGNNYDSELSFLRTKLGNHALLKENPYKSESRNIRPSNTQTIVMLIISLACIILFYYLFNKYFK